MAGRRLTNNEELFEKSNRLIIILIQASLVIAILFSTIRKEWIILFTSLLTLVLSFLPYFIQRKYKISIPIEFQLFAVLFIYAAEFLGEVHGYFIKLWWWDLVLHFTSAIVFSIIGFTILYYMRNSQRFEAGHLAIFIFTFTFAIAIGALWEIFEFLADILLGWNMQKSGLIDTMTDLIVNTVAAFIVSIFGLNYLKKSEGPMKIVIKRIESKNPRIFKKRKNKK